MCKILKSYRMYVQAVKNGKKVTYLKHVNIYCIGSMIINYNFVIMQELQGYIQMETDIRIY